MSSEQCQACQKASQAREAFFVEQSSAMNSQASASDSEEEFRSCVRCLLIETEKAKNEKKTKRRAGKDKAKERAKLRLFQSLCGRSLISNKKLRLLRRRMSEPHVHRSLRDNIFVVEKSSRCIAPTLCFDASSIDVE